MVVTSRLVMLCATTVVLWGLWAFFGRIALMKRMTPGTIFIAEVGISVICAAVVAVVIWSRREQSLFSSSSWNVFGVFSGGALAVGLLTYYFALEQGNISLVSPLTAAYPVVSVALAYVVLNERPTPLQWVGIILVIVGTILLVSAPPAKVPPS